MDNLAEVNEIRFLKIKDHAIFGLLQITWMMIVFGACAIAVGAMGIAFFKVDFKLGVVLIVSTDLSFFT